MKTYECDACNVTAKYIDMHIFGNTLLCDPCAEELDNTAVHIMPGFVTDGTLPELLPVLARAFVKNFGRTARHATLSGTVG